MSQDILVKVDSLSKKFCRDLRRSLWYGVKDVFGELKGDGGVRHNLRPKEFWSLRNVSFELRRGECLGLIGPNGAGKSTLLKMLNGLIKPDCGQIALSGRVGGLIELGAGFNPILTGLENIYVNGSVLGMSKREIDAKLDAIIEFSEIRDFIESPVQNYSSGMKVRLGFAVAIQMKPDILLIDEVLAVGDVGFRSKCYNALYEIRKTAAVIFVTHNMPQVSRLCDKAIVLNNGQAVVCAESVPEAISTYFHLFKKEDSKVIETGANRIFDFQLKHQWDRDHYVISIYDDLCVSFKAKIEDEYSSLEVNLAILSESNEVVGQLNTRYQGVGVINSGGGHASVFESKIPSLNLRPGFYLISVMIIDEKTNDILSWHHAATRFKVEGDYFGSGIVQYKGSWEISRPQD